MKTINVTLRFRCTTTDHPELEEVGDYLEGVLRQWSDGRRPFHVESMQVSMAQILTDAIRAQADDFCQTEYGTERVVTSPTSSTSRAHLEAEELCEKLRVIAGCPVAVGVSTDADEVTEAPRVLRRYVPGQDATKRPFETRAEVNPTSDYLRVWAVYTDDEGGTLAGFGLNRQERDALLSFLLAVRSREEESR